VARGVEVLLLDLELQRREVLRLVALRRIRALHDRVFTLREEQVQLHRVGAVDVGVVEEELLLEHQRLGVADALLVQRLARFAPLVGEHQRKFLRIVDAHLLADVVDDLAHQ
jgi:hypothetical protein